MVRQRLYERLRPGPHGRERSHAQVLEHQRLRLHGAMVEATAELGYPRVTVQLLVELAAVSKRSFYEHFSGKQECFLAAFDSIVADATASMGTHAAVGSDEGPRLRESLVHSLAHIAAHPRHARLCIVEAPLAGAAARARVEALRTSVRLALKRATDDAFGAQAPPPLALRGVVHGLCQIVRSRLLTGEVEQLAELAEEVHRWLLSYRCPAHVLGAAPEIVRARPIAAPREPGAGGDTRRRLHRAVLELAGRRGLDELGEHALLELSGVKRLEFEELYRDAHACFLDALGLLAAEALAQILAGARTPAQDSWPAVVRASIVALLDWLTREPTLARAAFVEAFDGGPDLQVRTQYLLSGFANLLRRCAPEHCAPTQTLAEGIVAAVWGVLHDYLVHGAIDRLADLGDHLSYIVLAPMIGADRAIDALGLAGGSK